MTTQPFRATPSFDVGAFHRFEHAGWESNAAGWLQHFESVSTQSISALLATVGVLSEQPNTDAKLLDLACGPGYAAGKAAARGAQATGADFSAAQVDIAREKFPNAAFEVADAQDLPYLDESFDAVVINFGIQHFPEPKRALNEAWRVLRPGGRIAYTVWAKPPAALGFHLVQEAIEKHGNASAEIPAGPDYYRYAEEAESVGALRTAGFHAPRVSLVPQTWRVADAAGVLTAVADGTVRAGALLRAQSPDERAAIERAVAAAIVRYRRHDGMVELPMPAVLASATKLA